MGNPETMKQYLSLSFLRNALNLYNDLHVSWAFRGVVKYVIQQKCRPMPMKGIGVSIFQNYTWFKGYDCFNLKTLNMRNINPYL